MNLISERSINRSLKIIDGRGKKFEYPYEFDDNLIVTSNWHMDNFMILDIISNTFVSKFWNKLNLKIPKTPYDDNVLYFTKHLTKETMKDINNIENKTCFFIDIEDKELFVKYKELLKYNSTQLYDLFKSTSECKFKIKYPVRVYDIETKKYKIEIYNNFDYEFENLFDIEIIDEKRSKSNKLFGLSYKISFNSRLSKLFINNLISVNYDWLDFESYSLKNTSQLLYRKYLLTNTKKIKNFEINYDDFVSVLGLNVNNITVAKKNISFGLEELKVKEKLKTWRYGNGGRRDLIYYEFTR